MFSLTAGSLCSRLRGGGLTPGVRSDAHECPEQLDVTASRRPCAAPPELPRSVRQKTKHPRSKRTHHDLWKPCRLARLCGDAQDFRADYLYLETLCQGETCFDIPTYVVDFNRAELADHVETGLAMTLDVGTRTDTIRIDAQEIACFLDATEAGV